MGLPGLDFCSPCTLFRLVMECWAPHLADENGWFTALGPRRTSVVAGPGVCPLCSRMGLSRIAALGGRSGQSLGGSCPVRGHSDLRSGGSETPRPVGFSSRDGPGPRCRNPNRRRSLNRRRNPKRRGNPKRRREPSSLVRAARSRQSTGRAGQGFSRRPDHGRRCQIRGPDD